jgi:adenine-specific DNA methylase
MFGDVFVVSNIAVVGGTNSAVRTGILLYDVLANKIDQVDIIINTYFTNNNTENQQEVFDMIQNFSGQALQPHVHAKISWHHF